MLPVAGIHYPKDYIFECENVICRDRDGNLRSDRTTAITWYFETTAGFEGILHCEECQCRRPFLSTNKIANATIKRVRGEEESGKKQFHKVEKDDTVHKQLAGFKLYCKKNFDFEIPGKKEEETAPYIIQYIKNNRDLNTSSTTPNHPVDEIDSVQKPDAVVDNVHDEDDDEVVRPGRLAARKRSDKVAVQEEDSDEVVCTSVAKRFRRH